MLYLRKTANIISYVFHPVFIFFYAYLTLILLSAYGSIDTFKPYLHIYRFLYISIYLFVFTVILPLLIIYFVKRDFHIRDRSMRNLPYIITLILYLTLYFLLSRLVFPDILKKFIFGMIIGLILLLIANQFIKVSMHTSGISGLLALFLSLYMKEPLQFYILLIITTTIAGIIGTARFALDEHNQKEIYLGYMIGFVSVYPILQLSVLPF